MRRLFFKVTLLLLGLAFGHETDGDDVVSQIKVALLGTMSPPTKDGLRKLEDVLLKLSKRGHSIDQATKEALDEVSKAIETDLEPEVVKKIETTSAQLLGLSELFLKCEAQMDSMMNSSMSSQQEVVTYRADHKLCRTQESEEVVEYDACQRMYNSAYNVQVSSCQTVDAVNQIPSALECLLQPGEDAEAFYLRKLASFEASLEKLLEKKAECGNATMTTSLFKASCDTKHSSYTSTKTICDDKQMVLDTTICKLKVHMSTDCEQYEACRDQAFKSFALANASAEFDEEAAKEMWKQLQQIKCITKAIAAGPNEDALAACVTEQISVAHLEVNYTSIPPISLCQSMAEEPGSEEYMAALYGDLPANTPAEACKASCCLKATTTVTTTPARPMFGGSSMANQFR